MALAAALPFHFRKKLMDKHDKSLTLSLPWFLSFKLIALIQDVIYPFNGHAKLKRN